MHSEESSAPFRIASKLDEGSIKRYFGELSAKSELLKSEAAKFLLKRARARRGVPVPAPDCSVDDGDATTDDASSTLHRTEGLRGCVGPHLVARISDVIAWTKIEDGAPLDPKSKPARLALRKEKPPPFVMISYTQQWSKTRWSKLARELEKLQAKGWQYVWLDVVVVDDDLEYSQAEFEKAMRFAVEESSAVYCPMSTSYSDSLHYFKRPWCNYECCASMVRDAFWIDSGARVRSRVGRE